MIALYKYVWIGRIAARSNLAYLAEAMARFIFLGLVLYIFLQLWTVTYAELGTERLGGFTLAQMLWYLAVTEALVLSTPKVSMDVDADVRTGNLAIQMLRPLSYPAYQAAKALGERIVRFTLNLAAAGVIALIFVGPIPMEGRGLLMFMAVLPMALAMDVVAYVLIGFGAFWLESTNGLLLIYSRLTMIAGGMLLPVELFPEIMQPVLRVLPFANALYGPARMFVAPESGFMVSVLALQGAGILLLTLALTLVYRAAVRRVYSNGG